MHPEEIVYYVNRRGARKAVIFYLILLLTFLIFQLYVSPNIGGTVWPYASKDIVHIAGIGGIVLFSILCLMFQQGMGWWSDEATYHEYHEYIKWHWIYLEFGTLIVGAIMAWKYSYPFLVMPVAVTLWYMSMDMAVMLTGGQYDYEFRAFVSMWFGLLTTFIAFWVDIRSRQTGDYAFWLYIFGVIAFWCGLSMQHSDSELSKFIYFCINLGLIGIGAVLVRRVFVVFGVLGCAGYFEHLASTIFENSWLFPIALTVIGLSIVYLGIIWQRKEEVITKEIRSVLPVELQELLSERSS